MIATTVNFGSNSEPHEMLLDTGSFWTWIESSECPDCPTMGNFDPETSSTWKYD